MFQPALLKIKVFPYFKNYDKYNEMSVEDVATWVHRCNRK